MAELNAAFRRPRGVRARGTDRHRDRTGDRRRSDRRRNGSGNRVVGETPNLAARVQALAQTNQIIVSAATRAMLGDHFDLADLGAGPPDEKLSIDIGCRSLEVDQLTMEFFETIVIESEAEL